MTEVKLTKLNNPSEWEFIVGKTGYLLEENCVLIPLSSFNVILNDVVQNNSFIHAMAFFEALEKGCEFEGEINVYTEEGLSEMFVVTYNIDGKKVTGIRFGLESYDYEIVSN